MPSPRGILRSPQRGTLLPGGSLDSGYVRPRATTPSTSGEPSRSPMVCSVWRLVRLPSSAGLQAKYNEAVSKVAGPEPGPHVLCAAWQYLKVLTTTALCGMVLLAFAHTGQ